MLFTMLRMRKPLYLTIWKFAPLSVNVFLKVRN